MSLISVSNKVKALLKLKNKEHGDLANYLGMSRQSLSNKFYRDSFSSEDLIKIADFLHGELSITVEEMRILFDINDLRETAKEEPA